MVMPSQVHSRNVDLQPTARVVEFLLDDAPALIPFRGEVEQVQIEYQADGSVAGQSR